MQNDKQRWDEKYAKRGHEAAINADRLLQRYMEKLKAPGVTLDVAAGAGDNACFLAQNGFDSFAVDISFNGLSLCRAKARSNDLTVHCFVADLRKYPFPDSSFDLVVVMRFLDRDLLPRLKNCVRPGGWMIYQTFNMRFLQHKPGFREEYVLRDGELETVFADWTLIETNDRKTNRDTTSFWVGRRPA